MIAECGQGTDRDRVAAQRYAAIIVHSIHIRKTAEVRRAHHGAKHHVRIDWDASYSSILTILPSNPFAC